MSLEQVWYNAQKKIFDESIQEVLLYNDPKEMERYILAEESIDMYEKKKNGVALMVIWCWIVNRPDWVLTKRGRKYMYGEDIIKKTTSGK